MRATTLFTVLLGIVCVACGAAHPPPPPVPPVPAATGRFEASIAANDANGRVSVRAWGAFDDDHARWSLSVRVDTSLPGGADEVDVVQLADVTYLRSPRLARRLGVTTPWLRIDGAPGRALVDVRALLDELVRSGTMRFDAAGESAGASVHFTDEGLPVTIAPPPASEVTDVTARVAELTTRATGG